MVSAVYSSIYTFAESASRAIFGYPQALSAPADLKSVISGEQKRVHECFFMVNDQKHSLLDYAIKTNDAESIRELISLGAKVNDSTVSMGTSVHHYIDCLSEENNPNIEVLNILLENIEDVNEEESINFLTPLEYALERMNSFQQIQWDVIERLLERGARITNRYYGKTPFELVNARHKDPIIYGRLAPLRSEAQETRYLEDLVRYILLERKYRTESSSALTLEEFKTNTQHTRLNYLKKALADGVMGCDAYENLFRVLVGEGDVRSYFDECLSGCEKEKNND